MKIKFLIKRNSMTDFWKPIDFKVTSHKNKHFPYCLMNTNLKVLNEQKMRRNLKFLSSAQLPRGTIRRIDMDYKEKQVHAWMNMDSSANYSSMWQDNLQNAWYKPCIFIFILTANCSVGLHRLSLILSFFKYIKWLLC